MGKNTHTLAKWLNNELSEKEQAEFEASPDFEIYQKIKQYTAQLEVGSVDDDHILKKVLQHKKTTSTVVPLYKKWLIRVAAIFIIGLSMTYMITNFATQKQIAEYGETASFTLPDNSEVVLNSGSKAIYKKWNWDQHRCIELKGEAYFKVAKGKQFEVNTDLGKVTVLGTHFNVKTRENRFDVSCYEGRVKVNYQDAQIILTHGQSVTFENGKQTNSQFNMIQPMWIDGQISFNKENFTSLLEEIKRQYNISIELKTTASKALFTGKLPTKDLDITLQIIGTTYNLDIKKVTKNKIIIKEK
jgi:ferric-dicitrate binding protein FerR (iron transport regulator)